VCVYMMPDDNNNIIVVDVIVANCQIRALRPVFDSKNAMPNSGAEKLVWWNTTDSDRLNRRVLGCLCGKSLKNAQKLVSKNGGINISGEYGSLLVSEEDFIRTI
jgi:hypothetical protein